MYAACFQSYITIENLLRALKGTHALKSPLREWEGEWEFERIFLDVVARRTRRVCLRRFGVLFFEL